MALRIRVRQFIAYFFRSLLWSINLLLVLYTCLAYWLLYSLQIEHWSASMVMITLPVAWVLNFIVVCLWLVARPWRSWLSGIVLMVGLIMFGSRTFVWHTPVEFTGKGKPIKVFSYNVQSFDMSESWAFYHSAPRVRRIENYVLRYDAPIKCFQEFFNSTSIPDYDVVKRFRQAGYRYAVFLHPEMAQVPDGDVGPSFFLFIPLSNPDKSRLAFKTGLCGQI